MDRDANYFAVGAFVLLVLAMGGAFVFWYSDQRAKHDYERYEIYFPGSVSGLSQGSPVRYLGVDVGRVWRVMLDPQQRNRVLVIADIDVSAPIDSRTLARLSLQGITGLLFIDLQQDHKNAAAGPLAAGENYPVIRSAPSDIDVLLASLPTLTTRAVELVDRISQVFTEENLRAFHATLDNVRVTSQRLPAVARDTEDLVVELRRTSQQIEATAAQLRAMETDSAADVRQALASMRRVGDNLASTSERLDRFIAENGPSISHFTESGLPALDEMLRESRDAARDLRDLSRSLKENPSQLLYQPRVHGIEVAK